jgi:ketosteroid isomerase-like protein
MRTFWVLAGLLLGSIGPVLAAAPAAAVQKTLQADYNTRDKAVARRDIDATLAQYAPDFVGVSQTGKTHDLTEERTDFLHTFALPAQSSATQSAIQKLTLAKAGTEADVTLQRHGTLTFIDPKTHASNLLVLDGVYQDVWAKHSGKWLLAREQAVSVKATMNGKPL